MYGNLLSTQITAAAIVVFLLQKLKATKYFPLLSEESSIFLKRAASALAALGVHTGISHVWGPGTIAGAHRLIIDFPPFAVIAVGVGHWAQQFIFQEVGYQGWKAASYVKLLADVVAKFPLPPGPPQGAAPAVPVKPVA
jgi:hypothetical protein